MALFLFWERWGLQLSDISDMWWVWWSEHQKSWSHQNGHVINQMMFGIMQRRLGGQMEVCALCSLGFLVHCLKECATVLLSTAFWMAVNQVCVEPEDWRLLSTALNSLKDSLWMLGSPDDGARRATCLV